MSTLLFSLLAFFIGACVGWFACRFQKLRGGLFIPPHIMELTFTDKRAFFQSVGASVDLWVRRNKKDHGKIQRPH